MADNLISAAGGAFSFSELISCEGRVLATLQFRLSSSVCAAMFAPLLLQEYHLTKDVCGLELPTSVMAFFCDVSLHEEYFGGMLPSHVALAALSLTLKVLQLPQPPPTHSDEVGEAAASLTITASALLSQPGDQAPCALHRIYALVRERGRGGSVTELVLTYLGRLPAGGLARRSSKRAVLEAGASASR